jgi:hypothetical protein
VNLARLSSLGPNLDAETIQEVTAVSNSLIDVCLQKDALRRLPVRRTETDSLAGVYACNQGKP